MTEAQATQLIQLTADLIEWVRITGFFCGGSILALIWASTWRG